MANRKAGVFCQMDMIRRFLLTADFRLLYLLAPAAGPNIQGMTRSDCIIQFPVKSSSAITVRLRCHVLILRKVPFTASIRDVYGL